jgi:hypothetical protein
MESQRFGTSLNTTSSRVRAKIKEITLATITFAHGALELTGPLTQPMKNDIGDFV